MSTLLTTETIWEVRLRPREWGLLPRVRGLVGEHDSTNQC